MHTREVGRKRHFTHQNGNERLTAEPNELKFVMEWVVEERESTGHAQV